MRAYLILLVISSFFSGPASAQTPSPISDAAYRTLVSAATAGQGAFFIYRNADDPLNHGFASGYFGTSGQFAVNPACVDDPTSPTGCATSALKYDCTRGTVFQIAFNPFQFNTFAGLNFEEPNGYSSQPYGIGYNLTGAQRISFDVRSPTGITVQFGVAGRTTQFIPIPAGSTWTTLTFNLAADLGLQASDLTSAHTLFTIVTNSNYAPLGGILLVDNVQFAPVPVRQQTTPTLPVETQVCGVIPVMTVQPVPYQIPTDELSVNAAPVYSVSLSLLSLIRRPTPQNLAVAKTIADSLVYALNHDNQGLPLPSQGTTILGLHNAYEGGDLPLNNAQTAQPQAGVPYAHAGDSRLAGFSGGQTICGTSGFCLVLDGATAGNNSFAILALLAAYRQFQDTDYLNAANSIGNWLFTYLADTTPGFGGYYNGYNDGGALASGPAAALNKGKSIENNSDAFAAYTALAEIATEQQQSGLAATWAAHAKLAGDFVAQMFNTQTGCFNAGTVPTGTPAGIGIQPNGAVLGNDVVNTYQFLDANSFAILSLGFSRQYTQIDWHLPMQCILANFQASANANGKSFQGFYLTPPAAGAATGIAWEFTGQAVVAMKTVDLIYGESLLAQKAANYRAQIAQAQAAAPFANGSSLPAATIDGNESRPYFQCLSQAFQCVPERPGLAATNWAIYSEASFDPFRLPPNVFAGGAVNLASYQPAPNNLMSAGALTAIFGDNLATAAANGSFANGALPLNLGGTAVVINGVCVPLLYVSPSQINIQAISTFPSAGVASLYVSTGVVDSDCTTGNPGVVQSVPLAAASPGLFLVDYTAGIALSVHPDGSLVSASSPASPGETVLLFGTGFGPGEFPVNAGQADTGIDNLANPIVFTIGGVTLNSTEVPYAGLAPTFAGLYQFDVTVPVGLPTGNAAITACTLNECTQADVVLPIGVTK